jgi:hypothetical protein
MRIRGRSAVLCFVVSISMAVIVAASAQAEAPEFGRCLKQTGGQYENANCTKVAQEAAKQKFEWTSSIINTKFKAHETLETFYAFETVGTTKLTCKGESYENAEYTGPKTVGKMVLHLSGCETGKILCNSPGEPQNSGHVTTFALKGLLGVEKLGVLEGKPEPIRNKLELQLTPETGTLLTAFSCSTVQVEVKGCIAHNTAANKMALSEKEKFATHTGEPKPDKFAGGPQDECILEWNGGGTGFEEAGEKIEAIVENEEKIEANTIA